jgi:hypothetical protein
MNDLYINGSFSPEELNSYSSQIEWSRGVTTDDCIHINFSVIGDIENTVVTESLQKLIYETYHELDYYLTGIRYDIDSQRGKFVFSDFDYIEDSQDLRKFLLYEQPRQWRLPYTIARENEVFCIEDLYAVYIADYDIFAFDPQTDGFYLQIQKEEADLLTDEQNRFSQKSEQSADIT